MDITFDDFYDLTTSRQDASTIEALIRRKEIQLNRLAPGLQERLESGSYRHQEMKRVLGTFQYPNKLAMLDIMGSGKTQSFLSWGISRVKAGFAKKIICLVVNDQNKKDIKREFCYNCPSTRTLVQDVRVDIQNRQENLRAVFKEAKKYISVMKYFEFHKELKVLLETHQTEALIDRYSGICFILDEIHYLAYPVGSDAKESEHKHIILDIEKMIDILDFRISLMVVTGTLMNNKPSDMALIANLIVDKDKKFPDNAKDFDLLTDQDYFDKLYGKVLSLSYFPKLRTDFVMGPAGHNYCYPIFDVIMTGLQKEVYERTFWSIHRSQQGQGKEGRRQAYRALQWPSLGVDPDGNTGEAINYQRVQEVLRGRTQEEQLAIIRDLDVIKWHILSEAVSNRQKRFIYIEFNSGSGIPLFEVFAQALGYEPLSPRTKRGVKKPRYVVIHGGKDAATRYTLRELYNAPYNEDGSFCQLIVGTKVMYMSVSIRSTYIMDIVNPWWNSAFIDQLKNRISRLSEGSTHRSCQIYAYAPRMEGPVAPLPFNYKPQYEDMATQWQLSYFLYRYAYIAKKDVEVQKINRIMKQVALDCSLNYALNANPEFIEGSRDCNYTTCEYQCVVPEPNPNEIRYDTYDITSHVFQAEIFPQIQEKLVRLGSVGIEDLDPKYPLSVRMRIILNLSRLEIMDCYNQPSVIRVDNGRAYVTSKMNRAFTRLNYQAPLAVSRLSIQEYQTHLEEKTSNQLIRDLIDGDIPLSRYKEIDRGIRNKILEKAIDREREGGPLGDRLVFVLKQSRMYIFERPEGIYTNFNRTKSSTPIILYRFSPSPGVWTDISVSEPRMALMKQLEQERLGSLVPYYGKWENGKLYLRKLTGKKTGKFRDCHSMNAYDLLNYIILPARIQPPADRVLYDDPYLGLAREAKEEPAIFAKLVPKNYLEIYDPEQISLLYSWYYPTRKERCDAIRDWLEEHGKLLID